MNVWIWVELNCSQGVSDLQPRMHSIEPNVHWTWEEPLLAPYSYSFIENERFEKPDIQALDFQTQVSEYLNRSKVVNDSKL
jgi:hypothetical protein